jgi:hypothetical protein
MEVWMNILIALSSDKCVSEELENHGNVFEVLPL